MIIAIETSTTFASAAAVKDGNLLAEACVFVPQGHCENLLPMLEALLSGAGLDIAHAKAFAISFLGGARPAALQSHWFISVGSLVAPVAG